MASWTGGLRNSYSWMIDRDSEIADAVRLARRAVVLGKNDETALWSGGRSLAYLAHEVEAAAAYIDRALFLNLNLAASWTASGSVCTLHCEVALLDSETGPRGFHQRVLGNRDAPSLHEHAQQCNGTAAQRNRLAAAEQCIRLRIKAERTEDVRCGHLRSRASSETLRKFFGAISRLPAGPGSDCCGPTTDASHHGAGRAPRQGDRSVFEL